MTDRDFLSVEIFQTINDNEALALTKDYKVVKLETNSELYYDGKEITGKFNLTGTYSYTTGNGLHKTVPVYTRATNNQDNEHGEKTHLSVEIFQTLSKYEALALTSDYKVIKLETTFETYYDGKEITDDFCLAGTYRYTNSEGIIKTVPVYIRSEEYKQITQRKN